jgi:hypothetical protein
MAESRPDLALHLALGAALAQNGARQVVSSLPANLLAVGPLATLWTAVVRCDQAEVVQLVGRLVGTSTGPQEKLRPLDAILREAQRQAAAYRVEATSRRAALLGKQVLNPAEYAGELERLAAELRSQAGQKREMA